MPGNSTPISRRKSRFTIIRKTAKPARNAKLVNLRKPEDTKKILMPPAPEQYIKAKKHDFL